MEGAVVTMPDEGAINLNDTISGVDYAGIQKSYSVVSQRPGELMLPPARITFRYAKVPGTSADGVVTLPPETIHVTLPEGADVSAGPVAPVGKVSVKQSLDRDVVGLTSGDTLTRTVEVFAEGTQAMRIPPPELQAPTGVRVYEKDPVLDDVTEDRGGFLGGRRIDRVTYLFEKPGDYVLPAIDFPWFDTASGKPQVARAPEVHVSVAPKATTEPEIAPEPPPTETSAPPPRPRIDWKRWLWPAAGILAALLSLHFLYGYWPSYVARREEKRLDREASEPAYFARLERACRAGEAAASYESLGRWVRRTGGGSICEWCSSVGSPELSAEIERLAKSLYAPGPADAWKGHRLGSALRRARKTWLSSRSHGTEAVRTLAPLNPGRSATEA
jgi:hypothetical protein